jgi:hypothetical protein
MKYQLVLQWPGISVADYDRLISLEETIRDGLGDVGIVDGHDFGSGEMNIFVHTDNPESAFEKIKALLAARDNLQELTVGFRDFDEDGYTPVYPDGLKHFSVI